MILLFGSIKPYAFLALHPALFASDAVQWLEVMLLYTSRKLPEPVCAQGSGYFDPTELIVERGWSRAFVKKEITALEHIGEGKSVWPDTPFEEMKALFSSYHIEGKYGICKYVSAGIIEKELRYWVLNGRIYRRDNVIPDIVKEAAKRLKKLGGKYYTIDATPDFVVEVNPGESSERHAENSAELFAS